MQSLTKKISELLSLLKAVSPKQVGAPAIPQLPAIKPPAQPSMKASVKGTKLPSVSPDSKKDPRKVAQQIKDGSMSTKTQKIMFKSEECLKVDKNGQWTILKSSPTDPKSYNGLYNLDINRPEARYSGKDLERMQNAVINDKSNSVKNMMNHEGKIEPHVLVHFGSEDYNEPDLTKPFNGFKVEDGKLHVVSKNGAVVSSDPTYSLAWTKDAPNSKMFSFWVPKSKIHADWRHTVGPEAGYNFISEKDLNNVKEFHNKNDTEFMLTQGDSFAADGSHIHIMPGEYTPAHIDEIEHHMRNAPYLNMLGEAPHDPKAIDSSLNGKFDKWSNTHRPGLRQLHQKAFPHMYPAKK